MTISQNPSSPLNYLHDWRPCYAEFLRNRQLREQIASDALRYYEREHSQEVVNALLLSTIGKLLAH